MYRRRYESRRSSKPKLHQENTKKYGEELFSSWRIELFHPAMWHVALEFGMTWHWIRQCNVACGSGIMSLHSLGGSTLQYGTWLWDDMSLNSLYDSTLQCYTSHVALELFNWIRQVAAPCNVALGSGIMSLNSPGGSTLQCDSRLRDDMLAISLLHSTKRPPY